MNCFFSSYDNVFSFLSLVASPFFISLSVVFDDEPTETFSSLDSFVIVVGSNLNALISLQDIICKVIVKPYLYIFPFNLQY